MLRLKPSMQTLVLDQGYQPHRVITWQRAIGMLFGGKAEVVEEYEEEIRSPSLSLRMPAVVRLTRHVRRPRRSIRFSRLNVLLRDDFCCQYCGLRASARELTVDHVVPRAKGGPTRWTNVVAACRPCNHVKGDQLLDQTQLRLARAPVVPHWLPSHDQPVARRDLPEAWRFWVR